MRSFVIQLTHREKIQFQPGIYIIMSVVFWSLSLYVFIHKSTSWQLSPAESRTYNRECILLRYLSYTFWHNSNKSEFLVKYSGCSFFQQILWYAWHLAFLVSR